MPLSILPIFLAATPLLAESKTTQIVMIIDDGTKIETRDKLYTSLQSCLDDTQQLFMENALQVKQAWINKTAFPKTLSATCEPRNYGQSKVARRTEK